MTGAPRPRLRWLPAGVLALSLALTALLCGWSVHKSTDEAGAELDRQASDFATALANRIQSYIDTLPGLRIFGVLQQSPTDAEFLNYVRAISLERRFPGLALTFMADRVTGPQRAAYVRAVAADRTASPRGHPAFDIKPPGERPQYMVLRHTYPPDRAAFGYDLYDPAQHYRAAVDAALASGQYVATGPLLLARDRFAVHQPLLTSVVIRAAVYAHGVIPPTRQERLETALGVVGISFRTNELVRSVLPQALLQGRRIVITDPQARAAGAADLLFDSDWTRPGGPAPAGGSEAWRTRIHVADRTWDIAVSSLGPPWVVDRSTAWFLALGLALSAALTAMTHILVRANAVAASRVRLATAALQAEKELLRSSEMRYRMLFAHSLDGVMRTLPGGAILAANPAACAMLGRSEAALRMLARDELVDTSDPRVAAMDAQRLATGGAQGPIRMRRADGSLFEAEVATSTYVDADSGEVVASVIVRDVTERRRAEERLRESEDLKASVLDSLSAHVVVLDREGVIVAANEAWRQFGRDNGLGGETSYQVGTSYLAV
ncbi:MAG: CHASE domain-containing protein, partial [Burkholderiales bacterium]|nr:CHASE domain-containing protein [Burkholderiales bacterium]